jgi:stage V sporulation protein S
MEMIKVSSTSRPAAVAGSIAGTIRDHRYAEMQCIGAGALNQAVKALIVATRYLKEDGISVAFVPEYSDVTIGNDVRTAIKFVIKVKVEAPNVNAPILSPRSSHRWNKKENV